ncbi:hypothetical protein [Polluticoccus soli]|uniref:hypothetical protein n=1 Tax=Polluticoccus soli TaxID=3034150 RepID=UPI0023E1E078|nr:hypothetical protein [Flavipsychrobacter sp. JY13-12]
MKPKTSLPTVPLTEEERYHLQTIYGTRMRNFGGVALFLMMMGLYGSIMGFGKSSSSHRSHRTGSEYKAYDYEIAGVVLTKEQTGFLIAGLMQVVILGSCARIFFRRVLPFKKDLRLGEKEVVSYTIVKKRYFEHTGQCFFSLNDPNYLHHEVDTDVYNSMNEGDTVNVYRGVYSKYVFQKDARFSFI